MSREGDFVDLLTKEMYELKIANIEAKLAEWESDSNATLNEYRAIKHENKQLKQQLAEKDQAIENWRTMYESVTQTCNNDLKEIDRLNKLVAEKEKEIDKLYEENEDWSNANQVLQIKLKNKDQDKISFAVEKLEEMRKFFLEQHRDEEMDTDYIITKDAGQIADYLLDQIKQLKEMK